jgi:hypothetical protein
MIRGRSPHGLPDQIPVQASFRRRYSRGASGSGAGGLEILDDRRPPKVRGNCRFVGAAFGCHKCEYMVVLEFVRRWYVRALLVSASSVLFVGWMLLLIVRMMKQVFIFSQFHEVAIRLFTSPSAMLKPSQGLPFYISLKISLDSEPYILASFWGSWCAGK